MSKWTWLVAGQPAWGSPMQELPSGHAGASSCERLAEAWTGPWAFLQAGMAVLVSVARGSF